MPTPDLNMDPNQGAPLTPLFPFVTPQAPFVPISSGPHAQPPAAGPTLFPYVNPAFIPHPGKFDQPGSMPGTDDAIREQRYRLRAEEVESGRRALGESAAQKHRDASLSWTDAANQARQIAVLAAHHPALGLDPPEDIAGDPGRFGDSSARATDYLARATSEDFLAASASGGSAATDPSSALEQAGWLAAGVAVLYAAFRFLK